MAKWLVAILVLFSAGCLTRQEHRTACGPTALNELLWTVTQQPSPEATTEPIRFSAAEESKRILDRRSLLATLLTEAACVFDRDTGSITWPGELVRELESNGLTIITVSGSQETMYLYSSQSTGIALLQDKKHPLDCHYQKFPSCDSLLGIYGADTRIIRLYVVIHL